MECEIEQTTQESRDNPGRRVSEQLAVEVVSACCLNVSLLLVINQHYLDTDGLNIETSTLISIAWVKW